METSTTKLKDLAQGHSSGPAESSAGARPPPSFSLLSAEGFSLLQHLNDGTVRLPREHRAQRTFFKSLRKASGDDNMLEMVHRLRDSVILSVVRDKGLTGGVTLGLSSPVGGEGVSLLSLLLGLSLGECRQRRIAVFDSRFDMKRFQLLSDVFGLTKASAPFHKGPSPVVGCYNEWQPNLCFLRNAGPEGSMHFFSDKRLGQFFGEMRQSFDFTIIDLPPLLKDTTAVFSLPNLDRLYLVAEAGKTLLSQVSRCLERVRQAGGDVSGVIVNKQQAPLWSRWIWRDFFF